MTILDSSHCYDILHQFRRMSTGMFHVTLLATSQATQQATVLEDCADLVTSQVVFSYLIDQQGH